MTEKVTKVGPYQVPAGVIVFPCLYSILMYSRNWDNPQQVSAAPSGNNDAL
jgi:cytochrome P450